jgi:phosphoenolpyruvate-protein phosphotransferase
MPGESPPLTSPLQVMPISPGIAIGPVRLHKTSISNLEITKIHPQRVEVERQRLREALDEAIGELGELSAHVAKTVGQHEADIFEAQQMMLQDPELLTESENLISSQHFTAAAALQEVAEQQARELEALENETLSARAADVRDVASRVIRHLCAEGVAGQTLNGDNTPVLIVAYDLAPSDTAGFRPDTILGICTVVGGPTTHAAILARALEIPSVAGCDPHLLETLRDGQQLAIDGTQGLIYAQPGEEQERVLRSSMRQQQQERKARRTQNETRWRNRPGSTADDQQVQVFANVGDVEGTRAAVELGAEGIGLLRTEFLFGGRQVFPDEQEQFASYVELFRAFAEQAKFGKTIIARTLDAGADKPFPALEPLIGALQEANPALGLRGARIHLAYEELLRQQLRALLRAGVATGVDLAIMFPMIATVEEVRRLRAIYDGVRWQLEDEDVVVSSTAQVGIMVETPAAALMADVLAREIDFFSIGANDLFQYTMAADRTNNRVMSMFGTLEPAIWRSIDMVVRAGLSHGKLVAVCGELAADPRIGPLLAGLGVKELSMSPPAMLNVKAALHEHTMLYWQQRAQELLKAETAEEVQAVLRDTDYH